MPTYTERTPGIYRCTYTGCSEVTFEDRETKEEVTRWVWRFQDVTDSTTAGQIDKMTSQNMSSGKSNAHKIASGLAGRKLQPGDDTETNVGGLYDVVYGPNQAGTLTITAVVRVDVGPGISVAPPEADVTGDLPF